MAHGPRRSSVGEYGSRVHIRCHHDQRLRLRAQHPWSQHWSCHTVLWLSPWLGDPSLTIPAATENPHIVLQNTRCGGPWLAPHHFEHGAFLTKSRHSKLRRLQYGGLLVPRWSNQYSANHQAPSFLVLACVRVSILHCSQSYLQHQLPSLPHRRFPQLQPRKEVEGSQPTATMFLALLRVGWRLDQVVWQEGGAPDWSLWSPPWINCRRCFAHHSDGHCDRFRALELRWRACRHGCSSAHARQLRPILVFKTMGRPQTCPPPWLDATRARHLSTD